MFFYRPEVSLSEALDILYDDNDVEWIFTEPPEPIILTDEETVNTYLQKYGENWVGSGRPWRSLSSSDSRVFDSIRYDVFNEKGETVGMVLNPLGE